MVRWLVVLVGLSIDKFCHASCECVDFYHVFSLILFYLNMLVLVFCLRVFYTGNVDLDHFVALMVIQVATVLVCTWCNAVMLGTEQQVFRSFTATIERYNLSPHGTSAAYLHQFGVFNRLQFRPKDNIDVGTSILYSMVGWF